MRLISKVKLTVFFLIVMHGVHAQTIWDGDQGDNLWTNPSNWNNGLPVPGQSATINNAIPAQLTSANGFASDLFVQGTSSSLLINSAAVLNLTGTSSIGALVGNTGAVTARDSGTQWITSDLLVGVGSVGVVTLLDGASLNSPGGANIGLNSGANRAFGFLSAEGTNTLWTSGDTNIGFGAIGVVSIQNGAHASFTSLVLGQDSVLSGAGSATLILSGTDSLLTTDSLDLGASVSPGAASVSICGGAQALVTNITTIRSNTLDLSGAPGSQGLLSTQRLVGQDFGYVNFDGGVLQANSNETDFISGSLILNVLPCGAFIDSQGFDIATANSFSGDGQIIKQGSGRLTLSGLNLVEGAIIEEGTLAVDGLLTNLVVVNPGTTLTGAGVVGALTNSGTVAPGNGIGTLTVLTNHINHATGIHQNELNAAGQTDLLIVNGISTIEGGTLDLQAAPGAYLAGTSYTLITAAGGLSGQFANIIDNLPINYILKYFPNSLVLQLGDAVNLNGLTGNPRRVAGYINTFGPNFSGDFLTVLSALQSLSFDDLSDALDQLHPAPFQALTITSGDAAHMVNDSFMDRLNFLRATQCGPCNTCDPCSQGGVWISGLANYVDQDRSQGLRGFDATNGGFAVGYDKCFCDNIIAGVGAGYSNNYIKWNKSYGHSDGQNAYLGIYATQFDEDYYADVSLLGFSGHYKSKRHIEFADIDRRAKSKQCNWGINPHFGSGLILDYCGFDVIPFGEIDYYYISQDKFHEHGANSLNLHVKSNDASALRLETGVRFAKAYDCGCGQFLPYASISYVGHRYYGRKFKSSFNDQPETFSVFGTDRCFNQAEFGLGLAYLINDQFAINASYDIDVGSKRQQQEFNFELNYRF